MLKKLLKYDLKDIYKFLVIFCGLSLFFGLMTRIFLGLDNSFIMNIIGQICSGVTISMMFNILINNIMRLWVRFKQNLYGDESYLTHTLPVDKKSIYLSKTIASILSMFTSIAVIGLTLFIAYYSKENIELIKDLLIPIANSYDMAILPFLFVVLFVLFVEFVNLLECGFTGIILGHKMNNNKTGYSVLFGFITYMISQIFVLIAMFIYALFNKEIMNLFITTEMVSFDIIKTILYFSIIVYVSLMIIIYMVNLKLFKKGVDVD